MGFGTFQPKPQSRTRTEWLTPPLYPSFKPIEWYSLDFSSNRMGHRWRVCCPGALQSLVHRVSGANSTVRLQTVAITIFSVLRHCRYVSSIAVVTARAHNPAIDTTTFATNNAKCMFHSLGSRNTLLTPPLAFGFYTCRRVCLHPFDISLLHKLTLVYSLCNHLLLLLQILSELHVCTFNSLGMLLADRRSGS